MLFIVYSSIVSYILLVFSLKFRLFWAAKIENFREGLKISFHINPPTNLTNPSTSPSTLAFSNAAMYSSRRSTGITTQG